MIPQLLTAVLLSVYTGAPATPPPFVPEVCVVEGTSVQPLSGTLGFANGSGSEFSFAYAWSIIGDALFIEVHITSGTYQVVGVVVDAVTATLPVTYTDMFLFDPTQDAELEIPLGSQEPELVSLTVSLSRCGAEVLETTTTTITPTTTMVPTTTIAVSNDPELPTTTAPATIALGAEGSLPATGRSSEGLAAALVACGLGAVMVAITRRSRPA